MALDHQMEQKRALRWLQRRDKDFFDHWRRGLYPYYDETRRVQQIAALPFPNPGFWGGEKTLLKITRRPIKVREPWDEAGPSSFKEPARQSAMRLSSQMRPAGFKFIKILGWGGLGVCSLYEVDDGGGNKIKVVCKMDINSQHSYIHREIKNHVMTAGAKHVIQRVILKEHHPKIEQVTKQLRAFSEEERKKADGDSADLEAAEKEGFEVIDELDDDPFEVIETKFVQLDIKKDFKGRLDAHEKVLFIEFMSRGRFDDYIGKVSKAGSNFPDHVLWQVFDCLFRAVVGLAYPYAFQPVGSDPRTEHIKPIDETCSGLPPLGLRSRSNRLIHFDLEPLNVLVGDFDQDHHNIVPLVKISDLGLAKINNGQERDPIYIRSTRRSGKYHIYPPEQHTPEWDWLDYLPDRKISETAGQYNWWTNLYQAALVMWKMVTLCEYEYPPAVEEITIVKPDGSLSREWTYGGYILDTKFDHIDPDLRNLVAMCLIHNPTKRPSMDVLEDTIKRHLNREKYAGDAPTRTWVKDYFGGAPPPKRKVDPVDPKAAYENLRGWKYEEPKKDALLERQRYLTRIARTRRVTPMMMLANKFGTGFTNWLG